MTNTQGPNRYSHARRLGRFALLALLWIIAACCTAWVFGALLDFPALRSVVAWGFPVAVAAALFFVRGVWQMLANGKGDAMLYVRNLLPTGASRFAELRK